MNSALKTSLPANWKQWVAENILLGISDQVIAERLSIEGFSKAAINRELKQVHNHPYIKSAYYLSEKKRKYEALMDLQDSLASQASFYGKIFFEKDLSQREFLDFYYSQNRPVVLNDMMKNWKAMSLWTPEYFKTNYGNEIVEIQVDRNSDPIYEQNSDYHKKKISFSDYVDMVLEESPTNDFYMTANNHVIENPNMKNLLNDIEMFPEYLRPDYKASEVFFWFGPAATITPLHHDRQNIFMAQVLGRKLVKLIPPTQTHLVYNQLTVFSEVDCENPNFDLFPLFQRANVITGILNPGQVLFLPAGWWHYVKALDISLTVTFTNFIYDNPIFSW
ncbi:MAG: cupin-like domain-containing protein [Acidobacteria bacterium]|nr:cupin-like domain-containing protein [Acidobacteriota bacterium]